MLQMDNRSTCNYTNTIQYKYEYYYSGINPVTFRGHYAVLSCLRKKSASALPKLCLPTQPHASALQTPPQTFLNNLCKLLSTTPTLFNHTYPSQPSSPILLHPSSSTTYNQPLHQPNHQCFKLILFYCPL